jgi:hypothetical protein
MSFSGVSPAQKLMKTGNGEKGTGSDAPDGIKFSLGRR